MSLLERHPGPLPVGKRLEVAAGRSVVFVQWGRVAGVLGPGEHELDPQRIPFLSILVEQRPEGAVLGGDVFLAATEQSPLAVALAVGEAAIEVVAAVRVADPTTLLAQLGVGEPSELDATVAAQIAAALKPAFAGAARAELADLAACRGIAEATLPAAREKLTAFGLALDGILSVGSSLAPAAAAAPAEPPPAAAAPAPSAPSIGGGARVRMSHAGAWYSGSVSRMADGQCEVTWDGAGQQTWVPQARLEPEPEYPGAHPAGTRVLAEWTDGSFYPATVRHFNGTSYQVAWENGATAWLSPGQIRLAPAGG